MKTKNVSIANTLISLLIQADNSCQAETKKRLLVTPRARIDTALNLQKTRAFQTIFEAEHFVLVKEFGTWTAVEGKEPTVSVDPTSARYPEFKAALDALLDTETTVELTPIPVSAINDEAGSLQIDLLTTMFEQGLLVA